VNLQDAALAYESWRVEMSDQSWVVPAELMWIFVVTALVVGALLGWQMSCPCLDDEPQYITVVTPEACAALEGGDG